MIMQGRELVVTRKIRAARRFENRQVEKKAAVLFFLAAGGRDRKREKRKMKRMKSESEGRDNAHKGCESRRITRGGALS